MDLLALLRTLGGLGTVLGALAGALWLVRRYDIRLPGRTGMMRVSRLELVEKLPIDARRSVILLRRDGHEHLILISPESHVMLESGFVRDAVDLAAHQAAVSALPHDPPQFSAEVAAAGESFAALVERVRDHAAPKGAALKAMIRRAVTPTPPVASPPDDPVPPRAELPLTPLDKPHA